MMSLFVSVTTYQNHFPQELEGFIFKTIRVSHFCGKNLILFIGMAQEHRSFIIIFIYRIAKFCLFISFMEWTYPVEIPI